MLCEIQTDQSNFLTLKISQSTLSKVHVIETTKACKVPLTKARGKKQDDELSFFKASS